MRSVEERLRRFLLAAAAFVFVATGVELLLIGHDESTVQLVPYVLCGLGIAAVAAAFFMPRRGVLRLLQAVMGVVVLGSLWGLYEHLSHNIAFEMEIRPGVAVQDVLWESLGGASPLLASGILALAAVLALAATYEHPALADPSSIARPEKADR